MNEKSSAMNIAILDALTLGEDQDLSPFEEFGPLSVYPRTEPDQIAERIARARIVITNKVPLMRETLEGAPDLKLICIAATGTNNVDLEFAKEMGVTVTNVSGYSTHSVAQHTFALLFYLLEHLPYYDRYVREGRYAAQPLFTHFGRPFREIRGMTWGILGMGSIGREVARLASAFGARVVFHSTSGKARDEGYQHLSFEEILRQSHILSIHSPLNEKTRSLIDQKALRQMRSDALLLNLGRGGIVVEEDLVRALNEGTIAGAALDVLEQEPITKENPLLQVKDPERIVITPHIAWASVESRTRLLGEVRSNIEAFLQGKERNRVV